MFDQHWHDHLQLMHFHKGHTRFHCHSGTIPVGPGDIIILNYGELHFSDNTGEPLDFAVVKLDLSFLESAHTDACDLQCIQPLKQCRILLRNRVRDKELGACIDAMTSEFATRRYGYPLALKGLASQLVVRLIRSHVERELSSLESQMISSRWNRIGKVLRHLETHYGEDVSIQQLADMAAMGEAYFCRVFRKVVGCTAGEYLLRTRIHRARELLANQDSQVSDIADSCGFHDSNYFSRAFRKQTGMTPTEWRMKNSAG